MKVVWSCGAELMKWSSNYNYELLHFRKYELISSSSSLLWVHMKTGKCVLTLQWRVIMKGQEISLGRNCATLWMNASQYGKIYSTMGHKWIYLLELNKRVQKWLFTTLIMNENGDWKVCEKKICLSKFVI